MNDNHTDAWTISDIKSARPNLTDYECAKVLNQIEQLESRGGEVTPSMIGHIADALYTL
jgi:hypothetical protein